MIAPPRRLHPRPRIDRFTPSAASAKLSAMDETSTQAGTLEKLSGTIERVTFHNEESGFSVLKMRVRGHREMVSVVGILHDARAGQYLSAEGRWVIDRTYGQQFRAERLQTSAPTTRDGLTRYLASGVIKGIGPAMAKRIVGRFGEKALDIISRQPRRLLQVDGIGACRQRMISQSWNRQKLVHDIMVFLHRHGISTSRAFRIYKTYGEKAVEAVKENPYRLARDIPGIGFLSADKIAGSLGIGRTSPLRAQAAVEYMLGEYAGNGHCGCQRSELVAAVTRNIEIPGRVVEEAVDALVNAERLVAIESEGEYDLIYLASLNQCEKGLAACLTNLANDLHPCPGIDVEKAVKWVESKTGLTLAAQQKKALGMACRFKVTVITGGPGVGKTTTVNAIVKIMKAKGLSVVLAAPTGRAAKRMSETTGMTATTIHRLLAFEPATGRFKHDAYDRLKGDVFIIDESSMIDVVLGYQLLRAIPQLASVVLVGDVDQLPSIGPGCVLRDIIESGAFPVCMLTHIFRQAAASMIITNAHQVNRGIAPRLTESRAQDRPEADFFFIECEEAEKIASIVLRLVGTEIPQRFGFHAVDDIQVISPMQRGAAGCQNLNAALQEALNPDGPAVKRYGWTFRIRDKVMQTINDYNKDVFNGDIGRIVDVAASEQEIHVRFGNRKVTYDFNELDELIPAYATTIHKAQGSEYPAVVVPMHTQHYPLLQRNLLYTAITRAQKLCVMVGSKKAVGIAVNRMESRRRVTLLKQRLMEMSPVARE